MFQTVNKFLPFDHFLNGQVDTRHEGNSVIGIMANGQSFTLGPKNHFLVSYQTRQADAVDTEAIKGSPTGSRYQFLFIRSPLLEGSSRLRNQLSGLNRRSTRCILFLIMVQLDNFQIREILGCLSSKLHEQDGPNGKVWCNKTTQLLLFRKACQLLNFFWGKARSSHNGSKAIFQSKTSVFIGKFWGRKVHPDIRLKTNQVFLAPKDWNTVHFLFCGKGI